MVGETVRKTVRKTDGGSMAEDATVIVHFKDVDRDDELHDLLEKRCEHLAAEFPETSRYELSITPVNNDINVHARVSGKNTSIASHAAASQARQAAETALDRLERELRKDHDKRIFTPRRAAKREKAKRSS
jgi:ribosome-associated translation inhibitor RaiA